MSPSGRPKHSGPITSIGRGTGGVRIRYRPTISIQKVKAVWTARSDLSGWCETGLTYDFYGIEPVKFVAWGHFNDYGEDFFGVAKWNTSQRFHTGYHMGDGYHYFWMNNAIVAKLHKSYVNNMTSCWPRTNAEVDLFSGASYDNDASFTGLLYKEPTWGVWTYWGTSGRTFRDNDPNNSNHIGNNTVSVY